MNTPEQFMEYFRSNYPGPNTVIARPDWHAPKIYRAAIAASAHDDLLEACKAAVSWLAANAGRMQANEFTHPEAVANIQKDLVKLHAAIAKAEGR